MHLNAKISDKGKNQKGKIKIKMSVCTNDTKKAKLMNQITFKYLYRCKSRYLLDKK